MVVDRSSATAASRDDVATRRLPASPNPAGRFPRSVARSYTAAPLLTNAAPRVDAAAVLRA